MPSAPTMKPTPLASTTVPAVRFGSAHGYRFDGDSVELHATFIIASRTAHDRVWALQLWACPSVPARSDDLVGHLVAEAPLPPIAEIAGEAEPFLVSAVAQPPAGDRDHSMVLVLVARRGSSGAFDEVHDVASFPTRERFLLPRLVGPVTYRIEGDRVRIDVAAIENPRDAANLSGTISLEVWALPSPYSGGHFRGAPLAGAVLGTLAGRSRWDQLALDLPYTAPLAGETHVVVMVREWTGAGYTTRDFANLGALTAPGAPAATPAPAAAASTSPAATPTPAADPTATPTRAPAVPTTPGDGKVSLNSATLEQLLTVKGLPRAVAERIVRDRPFSKIDDVLQVKGMGEKLLAKVRSQLAL